MLLTTLLTFLVSPSAVLAAPPKATHAKHLRDPGFPNWPGGSSSTGQPSSTCYTISGWQGGKGRPTTTTSTQTLRPTTITVIRTSTVITISTPVVTASSTVTSTSTATTTALGVTDTFTSIITSTLTASASTTTTTTITSTSTDTSTSTSTETSTVPAPAGFTPIYDSSGYTSLNGAQRLKREALDTLQNKPRSSPANRQWPGGQGPPTVQEVKCVIVIQPTSTAFTTVTTTSTIRARPTTTTVATTITYITTTTIVPGPVTTTVSTITTTTTTSTSTSTETSTETDSTTTTTTTTSTTSFYAACATNNILGPQVSQNGMYVQGVGNSDPNGIQADVPVGSAYDCCVLCITGTAVANCQNTIYDADTGICNPIGGDTAVCPNGEQGNSGYVLLSTGQYNRYDSNGPCGTLGPDPGA
ncbi:uncharacterized protein Z520_02570 [Fonsecaea multimorphosa CBS 102226]|uniref:Apple domain-containing protein n=1 Tax=Fonsecaea multimorphosa CBS 102226 TaxID=1442371 RepID=A0A0D2HKQ4_9EURO|nr:uncharacterized protein Z520_02570 [Fonsecaea multimorphosa CBS 102226]KIY02431.1 hypothetical protein Z520_02570 [Fonsecaea multimorphosa CBS 102226]OAL29072.1 hypothetical protein AYO22_02509 [Fonsecaea multimorphosa]